MLRISKKFNHELDKYIDILANYIFEKLKNNEINYDDLDFYIDELLNKFKKEDNLKYMFRTNNKFVPTNKLYNKETIKNSFCDKKFCLTYKNNGSKPFAIDGDKLVYFNTIDTDHKYCVGKMIKSDNIELLPNLNYERDNIYISAPSRSGKTYFTKEFIKKYKVLHPNNKIFLFSKKSSDKSIDDIEPIRIKIINDDETSNDEIIEKLNNIDYADFNNSLIVFDDIENISSNEKIKKKVMEISNEILNLGADKKITIVNISHVMMNYRFTKNIINESQTIVMFPNSGIHKQYENFNKEYIGIEKNQFKDIINTNSRWVVIFKNAPITYLTKNKIKIINLRK